MAAGKTVRTDSTARADPTFDADLRSPSAGTCKSRDTSYFASVEPGGAADNMKLTRTGRACTVIGSLALASQLVGCATNPKPIAIRQSAPPKSEFYLTITPRFILPGQPALLAAGHRGPLNEETYCPAWELTWPNGTKSTGRQDCPPYAEYVKAADYYEECMTRVVVCPPGFDCAYKCPVPFEPERRWTWTVSATAPGDHVMTMLFTVGGKRYLREVVITVPGTE